MLIGHLGGHILPHLIEYLHLNLNHLNDLGLNGHETWGVIDACESKSFGIIC
jgi:hypothetical protein